MGKSGVQKKPSASTLIKKPSLKQDSNDDLAPAVPGHLQRLNALSEASQDTLLPSEWYEANPVPPPPFVLLSRECPVPL